MQSPASRCESLPAGLPLAAAQFLARVLQQVGHYLLNLDTIDFDHQVRGHEFPLDCHESKDPHFRASQFDRLIKDVMEF